MATKSPTKRPASRPEDKGARACPTTTHITYTKQEPTYTPREVTTNRKNECRRCGGTKFYKSSNQCVHCQRAACKRRYWKFHGTRTRTSPNTYTRTKRCRRCNKAEFYLSTRHCVHCHRTACKTRYRKAQATRTRAPYFAYTKSGAPTQERWCQRCGMTEFYISNGQCVQCQRASMTRYRSTQKLSQNDRLKRHADRQDTVYRERAKPPIIGSTKKTGIKTDSRVHTGTSRHYDVAKLHVSDNGCVHCHTTTMKKTRKAKQLKEQPKTEPYEVHTRAAKITTIPTNTSIATTKISPKVWN